MNFLTYYEDFNQIESILFFWFRNKKKWFNSDENFDREVYDKYNVVLSITRSKFSEITILRLESNLQSNLQSNFYYLIEYLILFDQISRNIERYCSLNNLFFDTNYRKIDDEFAIKITIYILSHNKLNFNINTVHQIYLYFILLPLRHSKNCINCYTVIQIIKSFTNITNNDEWLKFVIASYRSYYNSSSHYPFYDHVSIVDYNTFIKSIFENPNYKVCIDPRIKDLYKFGSLPTTDNNLVKRIISSIGYKKRLCISLSGGVDSMVICHILSSLMSKMNLDVYAVHIQHSNRDESIYEAEIIRQYCYQIGIKYFEIKIDHIKRHHISRDLYESETRKIRFDFYRNMINYYNIDLIALGHHKGDIAENVLTNIIKGRSILDLPVMKEFDLQDGVVIWRPLLTVSKSEIFKYAEEFGIVFMKNNTPEWSVRGKLRNIVLPQLNEMFNSVEENLYNAGIESQMMFDYVKSNIIDKIDVKYGKLGFYFKSVFNDNIAVWKLIMQKVFHQIGLSMLKDSVLYSIIDIIKKKERKILNVCKDYILYFDLNNLIFINIKYFNLDINCLTCKIREINGEFNGDINKEFDLDSFINGNINYIVDANDEKDLNFSKIMPKKMKQQFNKILHSNILHKYNWIINNTNNNKTKKFLINIIY